MNMEDVIDNMIRRGDPEGVNHDMLRGIILHDIFPHPIDVEEVVRPIFNLDNYEAEEAKLNFRFAKQDIPRLAAALRIPDQIRTGSGHLTTGIEGLCIFLRRLAYPNRLCDLKHVFQKSNSAISEICTFVNMHIYRNFSRLLEDIGNLNWLNQNRLQLYADAISARGAAIQNCWGFIDGTARPICRPSEDQEEYYSGHKRQHCVKYQAVVTPDGITTSLIGAFPGRRHDAGIFRESGLYEQLENHTRFPDDRHYVIFGDQAYGIRELLLCPFPGRGLNEDQQNFNTSMSVVRQAVEWSFGKTIAEFAFLDFKKNQKLLLQDIEEMYVSANILTNCYICLYSCQTAQFFNIEPIPLEQYLN